MEQQDTTSPDDIRLEEPVLKDPESAKDENAIQNLINTLREKFQYVVDFVRNFSFLHSRETTEKTAYSNPVIPFMSLRHYFRMTSLLTILILLIPSNTDAKDPFMGRRLHEILHPRVLNKDGVIKEELHNEFELNPDIGDEEFIQKTHAALFNRDIPAETRNIPAKTVHEKNTHADRIASSSDKNLLRRKLEEATILFDNRNYNKTLGICKEIYQTSSHHIDSPLYWYMFIKSAFETNDQNIEDYCKRGNKEITYHTLLDGKERSFSGNFYTLCARYLVLENRDMQQAVVLFYKAAETQLPRGGTRHVNFDYLFDEILPGNPTSSILLFIAYEMLSNYDRASDVHGSLNLKYPGWREEYERLVELVRSKSRLDLKEVRDALIGGLIIYGTAKFFSESDEKTKDKPKSPESSRGVMEVPTPKRTPEEERLQRQKDVEWRRQNCAANCERDYGLCLASGAAQNNLRFQTYCESEKALCSSRCY